MPPSCGDTILPGLATARNVTTGGAITIDQLAAIAWSAYDEGRKAPHTHPAGPGFEDPAYALSDEWRAARDAIVQGLVHDLERVAAGAPMAALGEGQACDFCPSRGLCRRDFWS